MRRYRILVDGRVRARLHEGEVLELDLPLGEHSVQARLDWTGSPVRHVQVSPDNPVELVVEPAGAKFDMWRALTRDGYIEIRDRGSEPQVAQGSAVKSLVILALGMFVLLLMISVGESLLFGK